MNTKTLYGCDNPQLDRDNLSQVLDKSSIDRVILHGTFNLGDGGPITISTGKLLEGRFVHRAVGSGGREDPEPEAEPPRGEGPALIKGGGFVVNSSAPVVIKRLVFKEFTGTAISAQVCNDLEIRECLFTDPVPEVVSFQNRVPPVKVKMVNAILARSANCRGHLRVIDNVCMFVTSRAGEILPDDESFLTCYMSSFNAIRIIGNRVTTRDDGVEVLFNGANEPPDSTFPCSILIQRNIFTIHFQVPGPDRNPWPTYAVIMCCNNGLNYVSTTEIVDNKITVHGLPWALALSGEHFVVRNNEVALDRSGAALVLGVDMRSPLDDRNLGPSFNFSDVSRNTFSGNAEYGILFYEPPQVWPRDPSAPYIPRNDSHGNVIEENDFAPGIGIDSERFVYGGAPYANSIQPR